MKLFILPLLTFTLLYSFDYEPFYLEEDTSTTQNIEEKESNQRLIYASFERTPNKVYVGEIFPIILKVTSLDKSKDLNIDIINDRNLELIKEPKLFAPKTINYFKYYFKAKDKNIKLPDFKIYYIDEPINGYTLKGETIKAVALNPPKDFSNLLAKNLEIVNYQASSYSNNENILALQLNIEYGNFDDFKLPGATMQKADSYIGDINETMLFYYAIFPASLEQATFSYFNLSKNRYEKLSVPIIVKRDSVSTQSSLDPQSSEFTKFKIAAAVILILIWILFWFYKKRVVYPILIAILVGYLVTYLIPLKNICIKKESIVYLLPTAQSTPFIKVSDQTIVKKMNDNENFTKIVLPNGAIGWVKNEDICSD